MRTITVLPHDSHWMDAFERIKGELEAALSGSILAVEHVGSTSVPGLYAKPIIDIDIVIERERFGEVKGKLEEAGYLHVGDLGVEGREAFKYEGKPHLMEHHLYVCDKAADELKRHITLRDFLRTSPEYRDKYSNVKIEMASKHSNDIDRYIDGKQPVILEIYEKCGLDTTYKRLLSDIN